MMKLIGPWGSGYTRRVGITLKLLDLPFEHLDWTGPAWRESIRRFSPMVKVPALVLDDGEALVDSSAIIDYLYELAGPDKSLLAASGAERRLALFHSATALEIYSKQIQLYGAMPLPGEPLSRRAQYYLQQALAGFRMIEDKANGHWLQGDALSHADVMAVVAFQAALDHPLFQDVSADHFPHLGRVASNAMALPAFSETRY